MREPKRGYVEKLFPQLRVDWNWEMMPVQNHNGDHVGFVAIYKVGLHEFATPVFTRAEALAAGGEE